MCVTRYLCKFTGAPIKHQCLTGTSNGQHAQIPVDDAVIAYIAVGYIWIAYMTVDYGVTMCTSLVHTSDLR